MPPARYHTLVGGVETQVAASVTSAGAASEGAIPALDAGGKLDASLMPVGIGANTCTAIASEALAAGDIVSLHDVAGVLNARKADATTLGKKADGFVRAGFASAAVATVFLAGNELTGLTGLTVAADQFLSTTPGQRTNTAPSAAGNVTQRLGTARSTTALLFEPGDIVVRA